MPYTHNTYAPSQTLFAEHLNADLSGVGAFLTDHETRLAAAEASVASLLTRVTTAEGNITTLQNAGTPSRRIVSDLGNMGATPALTMLSTDGTVWVTGTIDTDGTVFTINSMLNGQSVRLFFVQDSTGGHDVSLTESGVTQDLRLDTVPGNSSSVECVKVNGSLWVQVI